MNISIKHNLAEYIIVISIFIILIIALFITWYDYDKNKKIDLTKTNHYEIILLIEKQKFLCRSNEELWIWKNEKKEKCFKYLNSDEVVDFFNKTVFLKNPYDHKGSVYYNKKTPLKFIRGRNYLIFNKNERYIKIFTLVDYNNKLLNNKLFY